MLSAAADAAGLSALPRGSIARQVFVLALPMLGEQFLHLLVGLVDTWLAGHVSKEATAAVGTGAYMSWFVTLVMALVGTGAGALVSRSIGGGDRETANRTLNQTVVLALILGFALGVAIVATAGLFGAFLGQTPESQRLLTLFIRIDALSYAGYSLVLLIGGVLRAAGDTRTPMFVMLVVNAVNIVLSAGLVFGWFGPRVGVAGIAIGTVAARILGALLLLVILSRGVRGLRLNLRGWAPDLAIMGRVLHIGLPAAADAGLMWIAHMAFIKIVAHTATGDAATVNYAAHMIGLRMEAFSYLPAVAWMTAGATLVGQYLGAGRPDDAQRAGRQAAVQVAVLCGAIGVAFFVLAGPIFAAMSSDPDVRAVGVPAFQLMAFAQPVLGVAIVLTGALRGAGDTRFTMVASLVGGICLRIPGAYLGGILLGGGLIGAWCGMWADNLSKFVMGVARFEQGGWRRVRV